MNISQLAVSTALVTAMVTAPYAAIALPSSVWVSTNDSEGYVNIRARATTRSAIQGKAANGMKLTVASKTKDSEGYHWYQIRSEQAQGWVRSDFLSFTAPFQLNPGASACQSAVTTVQNRLESVNNVTFKKLITRDTWHKNAPAGRTQVYTFSMQGDGVGGVMNSQVMSSQLAGEVIAKCPSVGLVVFNSWRSDWIAEYGLMPGGLIRQFTNCPMLLDGSGRIDRFAEPKWGEATCF